MTSETGKYIMKHFCILFLTLIIISGVNTMHAHADLGKPQERIAQKVGFKLNEDELAEAYYFGDGVDQDFKQAHALALIAYKKGSKFGAYLLGLMYYYGNGVQQNYLEAQRFFDVAKSAIPEAFCMLGYMHEAGLGVTQDYTKAATYYELAVEQNVVQAIYNLSSLYLYGNGVKKDIKKALPLLHKAAKAGFVDAYYALGILYSEGEDLPRDFDNAYYWFSQAVKMGHAKAYNYLGALYDKGLGVKQDVIKAKAYFLKGAEHNDAYACYNLGIYLINGVGGEKNVEEGVAWIEKAASLNYDQAKKLLPEIYNDRTLVDSNLWKALKYADYDIRVFFPNLNAFYYILFNIAGMLIAIIITGVLIQCQTTIVNGGESPKGLRGWLLYWLVGQIYAYIRLFYEGYQVVNTANCVNGVVVGVLYGSILIWVILAFWGLIKRKAWFPKAIIAVMILEIIDTTVGWVYFREFVTKKELLQTIAISIIWLPYFVVSKRVRNTFVNI
jgi:TPR repeat protein